MKEKRGKMTTKMARGCKKNSGIQLVPSSPEQRKLESNERGLYQKDRERLKKKVKM